MKSAAKTLANFYARSGERTAQACIYDDGVVLYLAASADSERNWTEALAGVVVDKARSDDGLIVAYILVKPGLPSDEIMDYLATCNEAWQGGETLPYKDNRDSDWHTIRDFVSLLEPGGDDLQDRHHQV
jgi:hypothetical protein